MHNTFRATALPNRVVVMPKGDELRDMRKLYHVLVPDGTSADVAASQQEESLAFLQALLRDPATFRFECERFAINVILRLMYGMRVGVHDDVVVKEMYSIWECMYLYFLPGTLPFDFFPSLLRLPKWLQPWSKLVDKLKHREAVMHTRELQKLQAQISAEKPSTCIATALLTDGKAATLGPDGIVDVLAMLLGAGSDTTSAVLQIFFKVMALHPTVVEKAQAELDVVVGRSRLPAWTDRQKLRYIRALIKELHRWAPIAVVGIPHASTEDISLEEHRIPKGTILIPNIPALSRSEECYVDPDTFMPERFLNDDTDSVASAHLANFLDRDHFHYGFGRRLCPGVQIAESSLFIVIAQTLSVFDIRAMEGHPLDMDHQRSGLLKKPKSFRVSILPRNPDRVRDILGAA